MILLLKDIVEKAQQFVLDFFSMFYSMLKIILLSRFYVSLPKASKKDVVVMGNGPSFKKALADFPEFFKNKELICVNNFPISAEYIQLQPSTLVWLDNGYYPKDDSTLRADLKATIDFVAMNTTWKLNILVPQLSKSSSHIKTMAKTNSNISIHYFNYTIVKGYSWFTNFLFKNSVGMPLCQNVVVASVFLAINMKFKNIYLTGVENSFFKDVWVNDENEVYLQHSHFYEKKGAPTKVHIRPGSSVKADVADVLMMAVKTFKGYKTIQQYAGHVGASVYNVTEGSYVDAFERKKITDLLP